MITTTLRNMSMRRKLYPYLFFFFLMLGLVLLSEER